MESSWKRSQRESGTFGWGGAPRLASTATRHSGHGRVGHGTNSALRDAAGSDLHPGRGLLQVFITKITKVKHEKATPHMQGWYPGIRLLIFITHVGNSPSGKLVKLW
jgi:hypothetical protein